jgi:nitrogen fixation protein FixH
VESSYKAGQQYNDEIEAAAVQAALGWNVNVRATRSGDGARLSASFADKARQPERGLSVTVHLQHPSDARRDQRVTLEETRPGVYEADIASISTGRWILVVDALNGDARVFRSRNPLML